jgi:gluconokinase
MEALGLVASIDVAADLVRIEEVVEPRADDAEAYARALPVFAGLYEALEPAFLALRELATHEPPPADDDPR